MARRMSVEDVQANFGKLLSTVCEGRGAVIVEENGHPLAVVITPEQWDDYLQVAKDRFFEAIDRLQQRNADKDPEEVERDVARAVEEVRREWYETYGPKAQRDAR